MVNAELAICTARAVGEAVGDTEGARVLIGVGVPVAGPVFELQAESSRRKVRQRATNPTVAADLEIVIFVDGLCCLWLSLMIEILHIA
jgi:hypothetical protein